MTLLIVAMGLLCLWTVEMALLEGKTTTRLLARFNRWLAERNAQHSERNAERAKRLSSDVSEVEAKTHKLARHLVLDDLERSRRRAQSHARSQSRTQPGAHKRR